MKILNAKKERAITLVVLVITIVVLLILAGVSISSLTNTGIFEKAKKAKEVTENAEKKTEYNIEGIRKRNGPIWE